MIAFRKIVDDLAKNPADRLMRQLIESVEKDTPSDEDLAYLVQAIANSGEKLTLRNGIVTADITSTGGPSSLSTLFGPLYLKIFGFTVPKLGVQGRPAGGIDVLAQIPSYVIKYTTERARTLLERGRYLHFLASETFAPLDLAMLRFRRTHGKIHVPELAIASILSKKIVMGVELTGLDVRVAPYGNFGSTFQEAHDHAERFCRIASFFGCKAICFLTDCTKPYQPFIGRGEALVAILKVLSGRAEEWLQNHTGLCYTMANRLAQAKGRRIEQPSLEALSSAFADNLNLQGSSFEQFVEYASVVLSGHHHYVSAPKDGFVRIDLESLRNSIVVFQTRMVSANTPFPDPCGVILMRASGSYVYKGDVLASVRCADEFLGEMVAYTTASLPVTPEPVTDFHFKEVGYG